MGGRREERRVRRGVPISSRAAALALQRKEEQKAALAHAKAVEDHKEAVRAYASIKLQRQKEASDAHSRLLLLCHPVELLPSGSGILPVVIPTLLPLFKVVAVNRAGALVSVVDGQERYMLDKWTLAKHGGASWPPVYSCTSAFATPMEAISEHFPSNSVMLTAPKVLVQLEAVGQAYYHEKSRKWALSKARVAALLTQLNPRDTLDVHFALNSRYAPTAPLKQHASPGAMQISMEHPGVHASPPSIKATSTASPHAHSLPSSSMIGATTASSPHATSILAQGGYHSNNDAPTLAAHTTSTVHAAQPPNSSLSHHPHQQHSDPQDRGAYMQHAPAAIAAHSTSQLNLHPTDSLHTAHAQHPQRFPKKQNLSPAHAQHPQRLLSHAEQQKPSPRVSVPIERVSPSSSRPSPPSTQPAVTIERVSPSSSRPSPPSTQPSFSLPPCFDSSYRSEYLQGPVQPEQLVARTRPSSPRNLSPAFQPPFDSAASSISRPPSPHCTPFNPAAGSHSSRPPTPSFALPARVSDWSNGAGSRSSSREPSPPPQPRVLLPRPQLNAPSSQAFSNPSRAPDGALPESAAQFCRPLEHPHTHAQASSTTLQHTIPSPPPSLGGSISQQPSRMQRHPASIEQPPTLSWRTFND